MPRFRSVVLKKWRGQMQNMTSGQILRPMKISNCCKNCQSQSISSYAILGLKKCKPNACVVQNEKKSCCRHSSANPNKDANSALSAYWHVGDRIIPISPYLPLQILNRRENILPGIKTFVCTRINYQGANQKSECGLVFGSKQFFFFRGKETRSHGGQTLPRTV